jgi:hypothetical protein
LDELHGFAKKGAQEQATRSVLNEISVVSVLRVLTKRGARDEKTALDFAEATWAGAV